MNVIVSLPVFVPEYASPCWSLSSLLFRTVHTSPCPSSGGDRDVFPYRTSVIYLSPFHTHPLQLPSLFIASLSCLNLSFSHMPSKFSCTYPHRFSLFTPSLRFSVPFCRIFGCRKLVSVMNIIQIPSGCAGEHGEGQS